MNNSIEKLIRIKTVIEYIQISRSTIYLMMSKDEFPKPIKIGGSSLWRLSQINDYINKKIANDI